MKFIILTFFSSFILFNCNAQFPVNDEPANAILLTITDTLQPPSIVSSTLVNATVSYDPTTICGCSVTDVPADVWFKFNTGNFTNLHIVVNSVIGFGAPTYMRIYNSIPVDGYDPTVFCACASLLNDTVPFGNKYIGNILLPNTFYYIAISDASGVAGFGLPFTIFLKGKLPSASLGITINNFNVYSFNNKNILSWNVTEPNEIIKYEIERKIETNSDFKLIGSIIPDKKNTTELFSFNDLNINNLNSFYYRLKLIDNNGEFIYSNIIHSENKIENSSFYPNPVIDKLNIISKNNSPHNVFIFTLSGKLVSKVNTTPINNIISINVNNLPKGNYLLKDDCMDEFNTFYFEKL